MFWRVTLKNSDEFTQKCLIQSYKNSFNSTNLCIQKCVSRSPYVFR
ncbi:hypothetical protein ALQ50_200016 [Pseudomonas coronafaciens pv. coronafaciens]|nr:hypothetical protein ALQ50_200016 [Pseudomonas coronafaciens pv. coronafaciens]